MNWSGGKDSAFALHQVLHQGKYQVDCLLTSVNAVHNRVSMHGVRRTMLEAQAESIGIPLVTLEMPEQPSMLDYESLMLKTVCKLQDQGFTHSIFGDIFLEDLRKYREAKLAPVGMQAVFPIWKIDTGKLVRQFLDAGFKTIVVCVNDLFLDKSFCGRIVDEQFLDDLPPGVDPCGENGEFHTFVFDGPIFKHALPFSTGEIVYKEYAAPKTDADSCAKTVDDSNSQYGFWFCDLY